MALQTKTITANGAKGHHKFTLTVTENSTSLEKNTSSVTWSLVISPIVKEYDWISNSGKVKYSVTINDSSYSGIIATYDGVSSVTIKSGTLTCAHNADGTKTINCSFSITDTTGWSFAPGNASESGTVALTAIARQANLTSATNFNDEENPVVTYSNPAGTAVTSLTICMTLDGSTTNIDYRAVPKTGTSYTFTLTEAERDILRNAAPNSNTLKVGFCLRTDIGTERYYSKLWRTMTIVNAAPTLDPTVKDTNEAITALTPAMVRYYSNAQVSSGAMALKGATIKSQSITCGGVTIQGGAGTFTGIQSGNFVFTVTDSRGNITTAGVDMTFVDYVKPTISMGNSKPDAGGSFNLTASGVCYTGAISPFPGAAANAVRLSYRYKEKGGSYSGWRVMNLTLGNNAYTAEIAVDGLDYRTTYIFQCRLQDSVSPTSVLTDEVAIKAMPVFDWGEEDFAFNVPVSAPDLTLDGIQLDYIVEQGTSGIWTYRKWKSGVAECWGRKSINTTITTAWGSLFTSGALTESNVTLPFAFTNVPSINVTLTCNGAGVFLMASGSNTPPSTTKTGAFELVSGTSRTTSNIYGFNYQVMGRWQ